MIAETTMPEKEIEIIKVTLDEIENAIVNLSVTTDVLMKFSTTSSPRHRLTAEGAKEAAATLDKSTVIALKSMTLLHGIMKMNGIKEMSGSKKRNCTYNKFCGYCKHYHPDKNTHVCTNKKSENFNINTAPFQKCSSFSKNKIHTAERVNKDETIA